MKKILTTLAMILTITTVVLAGEIKPDQKIINAFEKKFNGAKEATWQSTNNLYQVTFLYKGEIVDAFYSANAELVRVTRNILSSELPFSLQKELKKNYTGYWITGLRQVSNESGRSLYITVENADSKIVLISKDNSNWELLNTDNKN